jgi:hypothetical protein
VFHNLKMISFRVACKKEVFEAMEPVTIIMSVGIKLVRKALVNIKFDSHKFRTVEHQGSCSN